MVYSSPEPQFMCASAILKEEKITLQGLGLEAVDDYLSGKPATVWQYHRAALDMIGKCPLGIL